MDINNQEADSCSPPSIVNKCPMCVQLQCVLNTIHFILDAMICLIRIFCSFCLCHFADCKNCRRCKLAKLILQSKLCYPRGSKPTTIKVGHHLAVHGSTQRKKTCCRTIEPAEIKEVTRKNIHKYIYIYIIYTHKYQTW